MKVFHKIYSKFLQGYEVTTFLNPEDALDIILMDPPDLVISDLEMPEMTGIELLKKVRANEKTQNIPFVISTSLSTDEHLQSAFQNGATDFFDKDQLNDVALRVRVESILSSADKNKLIEKLAEERSTFLRVLCHDLSNPLNISKNALKIFKKKFGTDEMNKLLEKIESGHDRISDIVDFTRDNLAIQDHKKEINIEKCSTKETLQELLFLIEDKAEAKNINIKINSPEEDFHFLAEPHSVVHHSLANILTNAIKFTPQKGTVEISVNRVDDNINFTFHDTGIGIPKELIPKLFDLNAPTNRMGTDGEKGTGYGLPIVKTFIEGYGGNIKVSSQCIDSHPDDHWTKFEIILKAVV